MGRQDAKNVRAGRGWNSKIGDSAGVNRQERSMPYLRTLCVPQWYTAVGNQQGTALKDILALYDKLRDEEMISLGVVLGRQESARQASLATPTESMKARDEKRGIAEAKQAKKETAAEHLEKLSKGCLSLMEMNISTC
ncbi:hypothetical protein BDP27DRAFT_1419177 [Rhodocollybia butyracea]|uniref:Uncharacterized protein n=1 Tax=Rhodocollybia butyracea TaxID=206335 RepID=A0A9P5PSB5_9AGAR|nr:hypothetical protein BDP27DRAFT_1419177 [Rhodocollybia butyracea]